MYRSTLTAKRGAEDDEPLAQPSELSRVSRRFLTGEKLI